MPDVPPGIPVPDQDLKATIDKTVGYILKNGDSFESRLKSDSSNKFPFIFSHHQFYQYYQWKLGRYNPPSDTTSTVIPSESVSEPTPLEFLIDLPPVSSSDLKIIKLTALFAAQNGEEYLHKLHKHQIQRGNKAQFQFIDKNHSLHSLFRQFIGQYKRVMDILNSSDRSEPFPDLLGDSYLRATYSKQNKVKQHNEAQELKQRQLNYASIDWQDFAIIGKIEFDDIDKVTELAVPLNRDELIYRSLDAKTKEIQLETSKVEKEEKEEKEDEQEKDKIDDNKLESNSSEKQSVPKGMKIRAAGESRLKKRTKEPTIKCPITSQLIPESKFDEHIRILLRDPHYEQEKQNYITKNFKYSSNLTNDEVYDNIKRLTRKKVKVQKEAPMGPEKN